MERLYSILEIMKIKDIVRFHSETTIPIPDVVYHLYSLPSFDNNQTREELLGQDIQSNKFTVPNRCILFNKLNVRFKRIWRIDSDEDHKIASTEFLPLIIDENKVDFDYCFYLLASPVITDYLCGQNANTSGSHKRIDPTNFFNIGIKLPPLAQQYEIGKLLSSLDAKIKLNRQINQNLEAMAKQLYDYWFVQFDFPNEDGKPYKSSGGAMVWNEELKREIPQGWSNMSIGDYAPCKSGYAFKSKDFGGKGLPVIKIGNIQENYTLDMTDSQCIDLFNKTLFLAKRYDLVIAMTGATIGKFAISQSNYWVNQRVGRFDLGDRPLSRLGFLFNSLKQEYFREQVFQIACGCAQPNISAEQIDSISILKPNDVILNQFNKLCEPLLELQSENYLQIEELTKQRDELLPLLMNGQVSVNSDLAVSYIIYKDVNIRIMKENIIQAIVAKMQRDLDCRQMAQLKAVITSELHNVEIIEKEECVYQQTQENEQFLNSFISAKKIEGCSDKTLAYYRNTIERLLVTLSMAICHITTSDIRTYLSDYQEEHQSSKVTIDNMRRIFSSFFAWLEDEDYIAKSPVRRIHKVKTDSLVKEVLSDEQLEQLRDSCTNKRDLAIIDFLSSTGIRVGELVKLNREDIDFHERQCVVFGKGNKERVVYFNARTKLHLQQYLNGRTDDNPALFVSLHSPHTRLTISGVEVKIRKLGQALSIPKVHPHKFRRTLATMAIDKGMPIEQVQRLLGHVRIDTTLHYAIVNQNNVKLAHKKYLG